MSKVSSTFSFFLRSKVSKSHPFDSSLAVTLEGTVIHKAGTITGGVSRSGSRHFEDQEIEGLRRREAELKSKLGELFKNRPKPNAEEQLVSDIARIEADLQIVKDDLVSFSFLHLFDRCKYSQSRRSHRVRPICDSEASGTSSTYSERRSRKRARRFRLSRRNFLRSKLKPKPCEK